MSNEWADSLREFLTNLIEDVLDENELTMEEFCDFMDADQEEINEFLYDNGELSLLTIGKLLIGSNLAVEIKHVEDTEIGSYDLTGDDCEDDDEKPKDEEPCEGKGRFKSYNDIKKQDDDEHYILDFETDGFTDLKDLSEMLEHDKDMKDAIRETLEHNPERVLKLIKAIFEV